MAIDALSLAAAAVANLEINDFARGAGESRRKKASRFPERAARRYTSAVCPPLVMEIWSPIA